MKTFKLLKNEVWKDIEGYEGHYEVSNLGRVKSLKRKKSMILRQWVAGGCRLLGVEPQYFHIVVSLEGHNKNLKVHRVVAKAFIPNPEGYPQVNHLDGDRSNNKASNLQWTTNAGNSQHAISTGTHVSVKNNYRGVVRSDVKVEAKKCNHCLLVKPSDDFYLCGATKDLLHRKCKKCSNEFSRLYGIKKRNELRAIRDGVKDV